MANSTCSIRGCDIPAIARGWCKLHYERWRKHGDPEVSVKRVRRGMSAYDRVIDQTYVDVNGCRIYTGHLNHGGYGTVKVGDRSMRAHRVVLAHHHGEREDMEAMHICDVPACVEITHLRWGTHAENIADAAAKGRMVGRRRS